MKKIVVLLAGLALLVMGNFAQATVTAQPLLFEDDFSDETASNTYWALTEGTRAYDPGLQWTRATAGAWGAGREVWNASTAGFTAGNIADAGSVLHLNSAASIYSPWCGLEYILNFQTGTVKMTLDRADTANLTAKMYIDGTNVYNGFGSYSWSNWSLGLDVSNGGKTFVFQTSQNPWESWSSGGSTVYTNTFSTVQVSGALQSIQFTVYDGGGAAQPWASQDHFQVTFVPEPASLAILGLAGLMGLKRRKA